MLFLQLLFFCKNVVTATFAAAAAFFAFTVVILAVVVAVALVVVVAVVAVAVVVAGCFVLPVFISCCLCWLLVDVAVAVDLHGAVAVNCSCC